MGGYSEPTGADFSSYIEATGNHLAELFLDKFLELRGQPGGWVQPGGLSVDTSTLGGTQIRGTELTDKLVAFAEQLKGVSGGAYDRAVAYMWTEAKLANQEFAEKSGYDKAAFDSLPDARDTHGIVFFVDSEKLLSDTKYADALLGRRPHTRANILAALDQTFLLTDSRGTIYQVSFVDASAERRAHADAELTLIRRQEHLRTALVAKANPTHANIEALDVAARADAGSSWRTERGPETWKAFAHEFISHWAENVYAYDHPDEDVPVHSRTDPAEARWFGW